MYEEVKKRIESNRAELSHLEEAAAVQMATKPPKKKRRKGEAKTSKKGSAATTAAPSPAIDQSILESINVDDLDFDLSDSD